MQVKQHLLNKFVRNRRYKSCWTSRAKSSNKRTISDFIKIEKERGISVSTSAMSLKYNDFWLNLIDTPGHADFSEDTYRTLTAVDFVIMVIDGAKGVESQTKKLFEICRLRELTIITFCSKWIEKVVKL